MNRRLTLIAVFVLCLGFATLASAGSVTIPEFNGGYFTDPGPFPSYTVATIVFPFAYNFTDVSLSGTFGNSVIPNSSGADLFFGNITSGFYLVGQCFEFDPCWTSNTPTPWATDLGPLSLAAGDYYFIASQTSEYVVRLGETTITYVPEPSSLSLLLGPALIGAVGVVRRKFLG
jgi:hypothetical protein